jgi:hypothetical protein
MANATSNLLQTVASGQETVPRRSMPASGSATFYAGTMVCIPPTEVSGGVGSVAPMVQNSQSLVLGISMQQLTTTGQTSGQAHLEIAGGVFMLSCSSATSPSTGSVGLTVYAQDDHTVTLSTGSVPGNPVAGTVWSFDGCPSGFVLVRTIGS